MPRSGGTTVLVLKFADSTFRVHDLLLTCVEGMTGRAYFHVQLFPERGTGFEGVATRTGYFNDVVLGMYVSLHDVFLDYRCLAGRG